MSRSNGAITCQNARELFSTAADHVLGGDARERLDVHLTGCADCRRERERFERTVSLLRGAAPIRAPAGFVDRVLAAVRPEPWWRRLARRLVTPWAVKLPLEAAAVALVAITAVYLYQETPEQRQVVQPGSPVQDAARPPSGSPQPETPPRTADAPEKSDERTSTASKPLPRAEFQSRPAPGPESPAPNASAAIPRPAPAIQQSPPPPAPPPDSASARSKREEPVATRDFMKAHQGPVLPDQRASPEPSPPLRDQAARPLSGTAGAAPIGVEGRLSGIALARGRVHVAEVVTRLGGAIVAERSEAGGAVIEILLPRARYDELARELARVGRWTASEQAGDADPIRILVRLAD